MRVRVVGENQDESKWPLYRRRTRQGCYDSRQQQQSTEIYRYYLLLRRDTTFLVARYRAGRLWRLFLRSLADRR
jgi:hypothetical protein